MAYAPLSKGCQAAIPSELFDVLQRDFGTTHEAFASPLNFQLLNYCSAFPGDKCFGSLGSFFDFLPTQGSFEVNPPFIASIIDNANDHMTRLLASEFALQFIVVVPTWQNQACHVRLTENAFLSKTVLLKAREHVYVHSSVTATKGLRKIVCVK